MPDAHNTHPETPPAQIKHRATQLGFALCGICDAAPSSHTNHIHNWLADQKHGQMAWLANNTPVRTNPDNLLENARSIILVADDIRPTPPTQDTPQHETTPSSPSNNATQPQPAARIARYAQLTDYHKVVKKRLHTLADQLREQHPDHQFRVCVDTAPLLEREHAMRAGVGWTGKHTLTINRQIGSHFLLGAIVTTLQITPDPPETDHCGTCTRCIDACPTNCITPYSVNASRCISYLTIEHRTPIDPALHQPIGDWLYGCDICQDVCPHVISNPRPASPNPNTSQQHTPATATAYTPAHYEPRPATLNPLQVLDWSEEDRRAAFHKSPMKRAKLDQMRRNAAITAANLATSGRLTPSQHTNLLNRLNHIAADPTEPNTVRETAQQLLRSITPIDR